MICCCTCVRVIEASYLSGRSMTRSCRPQSEAQDVVPDLLPLEPVLRALVLGGRLEHLVPRDAGEEPLVVDIRQGVELGYPARVQLVLEGHVEVEPEALLRARVELLGGPRPDPIAELDGLHRR